jgi:hypothetical protein
MDTFDLKRQALNRLEARYTRLNALESMMPSRGTKELTLLRKIAKQLDKTLEFYDELSEPPPVAGLTESMFTACTARIEELITPPDETE